MPSEIKINKEVYEVIEIIGDSIVIQSKKTKVISTTSYFDIDSEENSDKIDNITTNIISLDYWKKEKRK